MIQKLLFRHCDLESLQLKSGRDHFAPELAVRVRWGTLRSRACSWGPTEEGERKAGQLA